MPSWKVSKSHKLRFLHIHDGAAPLAAQCADLQGSSKSRSNQPPAAGGPSIKPPPKNPDCSGQAGVSAWRHHPARCRDCKAPITAADIDLQRAGQQRTPIHHSPRHAGFFIATSQRQAGYCLSVREALRGRAWQGWAGLGRAGRGKARQGKGWFSAGCPFARVGFQVRNHRKARLGVALLGGARHGAARQGALVGLRPQPFT